MEINRNQEIKVLLVGGGSGGSVAPLLAVADELKNEHPSIQFLLVGTKLGPEQQMAEQQGIKFLTITSGKWRRYFSLKNLLTPFLVLAGFFESLKILKHFRPNCVFGTGSFVQVPLVWAAWFLNIPVVLHQQDFEPSLANTLCQWAAKKITVTFSQTLPAFSSNLGLFYTKPRVEKIVLTGNPFREQLAEGSKEQAIKFFNLKTDYPTLLVLGGGTGAKFLNNFIIKSLPELTKTVQIIHSTGLGKLLKESAENYHPYEFINDMGKAYAAADFVLARAGLSTITELANLEKLSIIVPMPDSHQISNALLLDYAQAALVVGQEHLEPVRFVRLLKQLLFNLEIQNKLKTNIAKIMPKGANNKICKIILELSLAS